MKPFFTDKQLNNMSRENMIEVMKIMQAHVEKKETEVQLLKDKQKRIGIYECDAFRSPCTCSEKVFWSFQ